MLHLETGELGKPMLEAGEAFLELKLNPLLTPLHRRHFFVLWAYGWLGRCRRDGPEHLAQLEKALKLLQKAANRPLLKAHYLVAKAGYLHLKGKPDQALDQLVQAQKLADLNDAPWVTFEVCKTKARLLSDFGKAEAAAREAFGSFGLGRDGPPHEDGP